MENFDKSTSLWEVLKRSWRLIDHLQAISYEILMSRT